MLFMILQIKYVYFVMIDLIGNRNVRYQQIISAHKSIVYFVRKTFLLICVAWKQKQQQNLRQEIIIAQC